MSSVGAYTDGETVYDLSHNGWLVPEEVARAIQSSRLYQILMAGRPEE